MTVDIALPVVEDVTLAELEAENEGDEGDEDAAYDLLEESGEGDVDEPEALELVNDAEPAANPVTCGGDWAGDPYAYHSITNPSYPGLALYGVSPLGGRTPLPWRNDRRGGSHVRPPHRRFRSP